MTKQEFLDLYRSLPLDECIDLVNFHLGQMDYTGTEFSLIESNYDEFIHTLTTFADDTESLAQLIKQVDRDALYFYYIEGFVYNIYTMEDLDNIIGPNQFAEYIEEFGL